MTKESEVEKTARFTRRLLKGLVVFIVIIVVFALAVVGIVMHSFTSSVAPVSTPTHNSAPAKYEIPLSYAYRYDVVTKFELGVYVTNVGNEDIVFSANDVSYNGRLGISYGNFAPQLIEFLGVNPISGLRVGVGYMGSFEIDLPEGAGSPWVSGMTVTVVIRTSTEQGSTAIPLPYPD